MTTSTWLRAASLVVGDGTPPLADRAVRIEDGSIAEVRPGSAAPADATDLGDATIAPGFVDVHAHLAFHISADHETARAFVVDSSRDRLLATAWRNGRDCLLGGVTTVRDLGDRDRVVATMRDLVADGTVPGPRIHTAGTPVTITAGHLGWLGGCADSPDEVVKLTRNLVSQGSDVIKVMASGGNMTKESNTRIPQFTVEELRLIVAEAHRGRKPVAAHAHNAEAVRRAIAAGIDTIEHCGWFDADGTLVLTDQDITTMREAGTVASLTMAGIHRQLLPDPEPALGDAVTVARSMSRSGGDLHADHDWARRMLAGGVGLVLSSDAGTRFTPFRGFLESLRCGIVALDIDAAQAISLAALPAARVLREDGRIGSVEPGKVADLVVLDTVIAEGSRDLGRVREVRQAGRVTVRDGRLLW
jgi:imidazolonepropionase-like amidohydrolase